VILFRQGVSADHFSACREPGRRRRRGRRKRSFTAEPAAEL